MAAPFAALSVQLAAAVETHLANVEADFGGAWGIVPARLEQAATDVYAGVGGPMTVLVVAAARVPGVAHGQALTLGAQAWVVAEVDERGAQTRLRLEKA